MKLLSQKPWDELKKTHIITTIQGVSSYPLPADYDRPVPDSSYDRGLRLKLLPISSSEYQSRVSLDTPTVFHNHILVKGIKYNEITIDPTPTAAGLELVFDYFSANIARPQDWRYGESVAKGEYRFYDGEIYIAKQAHEMGFEGPRPGITPVGVLTLWDKLNIYSRDQIGGSLQKYDRFRHDTDVPVLDETMIELAVEYLFLKSSGFDFADAFALYVAYRDSRFNAMTPTVSFTTTPLSSMTFNNTIETIYHDIPQGGVF